MKFDIERINKVTILRLSGKLVGGSDAGLFKKVVRQLIDKGDKRVVADMGNVKWINSTGIGILMTACTTLRKNGGDLKLMRVSDRIESILYVTKLNLIFECFEDEKEAVRSFE